MFNWVFKELLYIFNYTYVCWSLYRFVPMSASACRGQKCQIPVGPEVQTVVTHSMCMLGIQMLCKSYMHW